MIRAIQTASIDRWLEKLSADAVVFVPQQRQGADVVLEPIAQGKRAAKYRRLSESSKRLLLPQIDDLVRFENGRGQPILDTTERILFGLRPCDSAAVAILDEFFGRNFPDPNYGARRQHMRLIVLACMESEETCFCVSAGTGPVAVAGTPAGEAMIAQGGELFTDPGADAQHRLDEFQQKTQAGQKVRLDLERARKIIVDHAEPDGFWEKVADLCLMCGGCSYLCPTCTCYNIVDRPTGPGKGVRQRLADTCVLGGFTREASGHNPRGAHSLRCGHRYLHKLGGSDVKSRPYRCVGCGRCASTCITRMGIIRVVEDLLKQTAVPDKQP